MTKDVPGNSDVAMTFKEKTVLFFASGCFSGYLPVAPGTFGTLVGLPLCFFLSKIDFFAAAIYITLFVIFAIWIAHMAENILQKTDPGYIVVDEIAGIMITFIGIPFTLFSAGAGFLVFRIMDIWKPFPIRRIEKKIPGGAGVVMDDLLAGVYANLLLRIVLLVKDAI
ncbi:phosphatidylglycerophosphatase A [Thermodesulfobacteriota bacterium]